MGGDRSSSGCMVKTEVTTFLIKTIELRRPNGEYFTGIGDLAVIAVFITEMRPVIQIHCTGSSSMRYSPLCSMYGWSSPMALLSYKNPNVCNSSRVVGVISHAGDR